MSKSGGASHAMTDSDILESALPSGACRILVPVILASYGLRKMVTSVSLEHAATDPELKAASRNYRLVIPRSAESKLNHLPRMDWAMKLGGSPVV